MKTIYSVIAVATVLFSLLIGLLVANQTPAPIVTAAKIQALQSDSKNSERFLVVDVRDQNENDVSIIPGAITLAEFEKTKESHQGKLIITYCTVGYRSGLYAQKLRRSGWNAWNYKGSILDWCDHHLPVVTPSGQRTQRVHTYNSSYSLASGYQAVY